MSVNNIAMKLPLIIGYFMDLCVFQNTISGKGIFCCMNFNQKNVKL